MRYHSVMVLGVTPKRTASSLFFTNSAEVPLSGFVELTRLSMPILRHELPTKNQLSNPAFAWSFHPVLRGQLIDQSETDGGFFESVRGEVWTALFTYLPSQILPPKERSICGSEQVSVE